VNRAARWADGRAVPTPDPSPALRTSSYGSGSGEGAGPQRHTPAHSNGGGPALGRSALISGAALLAGSSSGWHRVSVPEMGRSARMAVHRGRRPPEGIRSHGSCGGYTRGRRGMGEVRPTRACRQAPQLVRVAHNPTPISSTRMPAATGRSCWTNRSARSRRCSRARAWASARRRCATGALAANS
jgi:hypothetical protein